MDLSLLSSRQILFAAFFMFLMALPILSIAASVNLPKTGQTTCYDGNGNIIDCTGTGQDGDIQAGVAWPDPRFTDNGDATMTDNLTGLVWAQDANLSGGFMNWQGALDYVADMNAGIVPNLGHTDWRLPNINELESLVNAEEASPATWLNGQGFTNVQSYSFYCSSTSYAYTNSIYVWSVHTDGGVVTDTSKTYPYYVWPVRTSSGGSFGNSDIWKTEQTTCWDEGENVINCAGTGQDGDTQTGVAWPDPRFTDNGDSTVTDNLTGLVWTQDANLPAGIRTWQGALDYVADMNAGIVPNFGHTDWRLPNRKGLFSLVFRTQVSPVIPVEHPFTNVQLNDSYWSSTSFAPNTNQKWYVNVHKGNMHYYGNRNYYVWPVRAGSGGSSTVTNPTPDIKANGSDGPVTPTGNLSVTVELDPGSRSGENADWWVVANTPFGWFHYDVPSGSWLPGLVVTFQGSLFNLTPAYKVLSMSGLPLGIYTFYFGVDMVMNGSLDMGSIYYDSVIVNITP